MSTFAQDLLSHGSTGATV